MRLHHIINQGGRAIGIMVLWLSVMITMADVTPAMPPHPEVQGRITSGEVVAPFYRPVLIDEPASMRINAPSRAKSGAITGPYRALCLLVDFSDNIAQTTPRRFDTLVFADRVGTVRHYYDEVSYGRLDIVTVHLPSATGWLRAPLVYTYYVDNHYGTDSPYPHNSQKLCEDVIALADPVVDFSQYDNDGDGYADVIMIVHAGQGAELTGRPSDIWSHKWSIAPALKDGVYISDYTIMPEFWNQPGDMTPGVYCHELGHVFGLPDLYDTDNSSYGTGDWSIMSSGSWNGNLGSSPAHPDAWSKARLGWLTPTNVQSNMTEVSIAAAETTPLAYRVWTSGGGGTEYFLVENRQRTGYDAELPGAGLLIWHIDEEMDHNDYEWYPGYTDYGHYKVALEQADNLFLLERKLSSGDTGDPFPGSTVNRSFSPVSNPRSDGYSGGGSLVAVTNISNSGVVMTADFAVSFASDYEEPDDEPVLPFLALEQNYPNPFNPSTTFRYNVPTAGEVTVTIYDILGRPIARPVAGYHQAGSYTATWQGVTLDGATAPSGIYFYRLNSGEETAVRTMMLVK
jgi:immune inhibitor A